MPDLDSQTRELLLGYLQGSDDLDTVRSRFMALAWRLNSEPVISRNRVTASVSLWLAEYGYGHRDEPELRDLFRDLLETVRVSYGETLAPSIETGTTATQSDRSGLLAVAGTAA